jgi:glycosyltransferase involved in cell wall biosynthesis
MKLLLVSYFFPPHGGGGVLRATETVRILSGLGWEITVLAGPEDGWWVSDESLASRLPQGVEVIRPQVLGLSGLFDALNRGVARRGERSVGMLKSLAAWLPVPDAYFAWARGCARAALERDLSPDWIISSSPPESVHMTGMKLARRLGSLWAADFRDPWVKAIYRREPTPLHRNLHARREAAVVRGADLVIGTCEPAVKDFRARYPDLPREKFVHLPNGFNPEEFQSGDAREYRLPLKMIHAGNLTRDREIGALLEAIARVNRDGTMCTLELAGQVADRTLEQVRALGLEQAVTATGYLPRPKLLEKLAVSHVGVLVEAFRPGAELIVPGKLYDYLGAGLPALAIVPPGAAAELVDRERFGIAATKPDPNRLENLLRQMVENIKRGGEALRAPDTERAERFRRPRIVGELDSLLKSFQS